MSWTPTVELRWCGGVLQQRWSQPKMVEVKGGMRSMWRETTEYEWRDVPNVAATGAPTDAV